jgi:hypothetical protein
MNIEQDDIKTILQYIDRLKENVIIENDYQKINLKEKNDMKCEIAVGSDNNEDEIDKIEEEERRLFQKAVEEYRNSLTNNNNNYNIERDDNLNKKIQMTEQGIGTSEVLHVNKNIKKYSCWECYKIKNFDTMITSEFLTNKV